MASFAFVNYARFLQRDGTAAGTAQAYQNFSVNQNRVYAGITYAFAPFAISSGAGSKGGDRLESTLGTSTNAITVNLFAEAVSSRWLLEIKTVALDPLTFADNTLIRTEIWRISRYEMDNEKILLKLASPLDAARNQVPKRYLSTSLVGAVPTSATLVVS
jgi:hypothetical protein